MYYISTLYHTKEKKAIYFIEVGTEDGLRKELPYVMQLKQGDKYINDYLVTEANSEDTKKVLRVKLVVLTNWPLKDNRIYHFYCKSSNFIYYFHVY